MSAASKRKARRPIGFKPPKRARRQEIAKRTDDGRGVYATREIEQALQQWKAFYQDAKIADRNVELARSVVKGLFDKHAAEYFVSSLGTIPLQVRTPKPHTDWEALARALLEPEVIAKHLESFTTQAAAQRVLAALSGWSTEVGC